MKVLVVDYDMGNLNSVRRMLELCGAQVLISSDPAYLKDAERIVLPGVGAFTDAMRSLNEKGLSQEIGRAAKSGVPLLGICLGMQVLADSGNEGGECRGLGLIPGRVTRFEPAEGLRIPHMGWNEVWSAARDPILENIPDGSDFYFVHSYRFIPASRSHVLAETPYGERFASMVVSENVYGAQFHPEKSSKTGMRLLTNFLNLKISKAAAHA